MGAVRGCCVRAGPPAPPSRRRGGLGPAVGHASRPVTGGRRHAWERCPTEPSCRGSSCVCLIKSCCSPSPGTLNGTQAGSLQTGQAGEGHTNRVGPGPTVPDASGAYPGETQRQESAWWPPPVERVMGLRPRGAGDGRGPTEAGQRGRRLPLRPGGASPMTPSLGWGPPPPDCEAMTPSPWCLSRRVDLPLHPPRLSAPPAHLGPAPASRWGVPLCGSKEGGSGHHLGPSSLHSWLLLQSH